MIAKMVSARFVLERNFFEENVHLVGMMKSICTFQLSKPMVLEENGESSSSSGAVCAGPPSPGSETMMDIDAECTSSEARLLTCAPTEAGPASTSTDASSLIDQNGESDSDKGGY